MPRAEESAYPTETVLDDTRDYYKWGSDGLTKREVFAAMAMQAIISTANGPVIVDGLDGAEPYAAKAAIKMADALLAELDKSV